MKMNDTKAIQIQYMMLQVLGHIYYTRNKFTALKPHFLLKCPDIWFLLGTIFIFLRMVYLCFLLMYKQTEELHL